MKFDTRTSTSFSTSKITVLFIVAAVAFTAATAFAAKNYNSSKSNTATSIAKVNEEVGNILLRYNIGGAEINKVTVALAAGIAEEKLTALLVEVGVGKESVKAALAEFDKLGIASEDFVAGSVAPVPSAISPAPVKKCGVNTYRVSNECGAGAFKNAYVQCYDGYEENLGGESSCKSSEAWQKYAQEICANRCSVVTAPRPAPGFKPLPTPAPVPAPTNIGTTAARPPAPAVVDRCQEVSQWENKIAYYKKLAASSDSELKEQTGFSRAEIERILADLSNGLVKVKAQCEDQKSVEARPLEAARQIIAEPVKPVAVESGREISDYYKAKIEKITSGDSDKAQIQNLQSLKLEIDELIAKLLGGRKEMEVSEFDNVVSEIKVSRGEIKADDVSVKTTDKKILIDIGDKSVSIAPTGQQVLIQDKNLGVTASEVSIKDKVLRVGNSEVKLAASKVAETLGVEPRSAELKEENSRAIYKFKIAEPRKLFGLIPIQIIKTLTADAESSDLLSEKLPWYSFLTTR